MNQNVDAFHLYRSPRAPDTRRACGTRGNPPSPLPLFLKSPDLHTTQTQQMMVVTVMMRGMVGLAVILTLVLFSPAVTGYERGGGGGGEEGDGGRRFVLEEREEVVKTDGGEVRVVRGRRWDGHHNHPMHIGFISMEPNTLFIPQYVDANLILFVRKGEVKVGWIYKDELVEKQLKMRDIIRIPAGSAFYLVNTGKGQRLHIICSIHTTSDYSRDWFSTPYQSFFLGGGLYPKSVLAGFDITTLTTAFNVTTEEVGAITGSHTAGPIVYVTGEAAEQPDRVSSVLNSKLKEVKKAYPDLEDEEDNREDRPWTLTKLLGSILGFNNNDEYQQNENKKRGGPVRGPDSYNLYDRAPSFKNPFGWTISLDEHDYRPLKDSDIGVYLVNLTAGSMLAPHINPRATEYGVVLGGTGTIQVVYPNGTSAMKAEVTEGDVFWIPRFFPFCQIASRGGPLEFFGFTTSARTNHPQFLVGASSMLRTMMGPELAAGMGVNEDLLKRLVTAQNESVILPTWPVPWEKEREEREREREKKRGKEERRRKKGETLLIKRVVHV